MDDNRTRRFDEWLTDHLKAEGWSMAELGRRSGVSKQVISKYAIQLPDNPDKEVLINIARALKVTAEEIFRAAGVLPPGIRGDAITEEAEHLLSQLPENKRQQALAFIRFLANENYSTNGMEQPKPEAP